MGKCFFNILATFAEFEVDLLRMRTREGIAIAKANGRLKGKAPKLTARQQAHLVKLIAPASTRSPSWRSCSRSLARRSTARSTEHPCKRTRETGDHNASHEISSTPALVASQDHLRRVRLSIDDRTRDSSDGSFSIRAEARDLSQRGFRSSGWELLLMSRPRVGLGRRRPRGPCVQGRGASLWLTRIGRLRSRL